MITWIHFCLYYYSIFPKKKHTIHKDNYCSKVETATNLFGTYHRKGKQTEVIWKIWKNKIYMAQKNNIAVGKSWIKN